MWRCSIETKGSPSLSLWTAIQPSIFRFLLYLRAGLEGGSQNQVLQKPEGRAPFELVHLQQNNLIHLLLYSKLCFLRMQYASVKCSDWQIKKWVGKVKDAERQLV